MGIVEWMDPEQDLRAAGLRCTAQRVAVLAIVRAEPRHWTVDELTSRVRERLGTVSGQAVYDAAAALVRAGLARRVEPAGSPARYEARTDDHDHLVCQQCGAVVDVDGEPKVAPTLDARAAQGFVVDHTEITFWGTCPTCQHRPIPARATRKEHSS